MVYRMGRDIYVKVKTGTATTKFYGCLERLWTFTLKYFITLNLTWETNQLSHL